MSPSEAFVEAHMSTPLHTIREEDRLTAARRAMAELDISALPVVDDTGRLCGVLTLSDLLRVGRMKPLAEPRRYALCLPDARVREHMSTPVAVVSPTTSLKEAATRMLRRHLHRVYVARDRSPLGVVTTLDIARAVAGSRAEQPIGELATVTVVTVEASDPVSLAIDRLVASHHRTLVVTDGSLPAGLFGQREALAARRAKAGSPVEPWLNPGFVCLPSSTPLHLAASRMTANRPRALLVTEGDRVCGIVTGVDFARAIAG